MSNLTLGRLLAIAHSLPLLCIAALILLTTPANAQENSSASTSIPEAWAAYETGNFAEALRLWQVACDEGNPRGCYEAAVVHRDGEGVPADETRAHALFTQACEGGWGLGCFNMGIYSQGEAQRDFFARGCELEDIGSCARLGMAYRDGDGVESDAAKAVSYLERACLINEMRAGAACFMVAGLYDVHLGEPISDDPALANRWLDEGCARNDQDSCQNLAWHYAHGFGLETDFVRSAALYQLACGDNAARECFFVPSQHRASPEYRGNEVDRDWRQAAGAYDKACNAGLAHGCFAFARLIARSGKGKRYADTMREYLNRAIAIDPDHVSAIELLRRVEAGELPDSALR